MHINVTRFFYLIRRLEAISLDFQLPNPSVQSHGQNLIKVNITCESTWDVVYQSTVNSYKNIAVGAKSKQNQ